MLDCHVPGFEVVRIIVALSAEDVAVHLTGLPREDGYIHQVRIIVEWRFFLKALGSEGCVAALRTTSNHEHGGLLLE